MVNFAEVLWFAHEDAPRAAYSAYIALSSSCCRPTATGYNRRRSLVTIPIVPTLHYCTCTCERSCLQEGNLLVFLQVCF